VDGGVGIAVEHLLVECADEGAGTPQAVDEFVAQFVTAGAHLDEFDVEPAPFQRAGHRPRLPQRQVRPSRRQAHLLCHARPCTRSGQKGAAVDPSGLQPREHPLVRLQGLLDVLASVSGADEL
jgi:hypothetical protein